MVFQSFILKAVKDTWVRRLRYLDSFYTRVAPRDPLELIPTHSGELERAKVFAMFANMHLWWAEYPRVPEFVDRFYDAQKKATRASLPITDDWIAAMATSALLSANLFPKERPSWDGLVPSSQTWAAWKLKFVPLRIAMERELRASSQRGD